MGIILNFKMVETTGSYVLNNFDNLPDLQVPSLSEVWTWQGDTSVLPFKFESILNAASDNEELFVAKELSQKWCKGSDFDPNGFFFITYRSQAIGLTFAKEIQNGEYEIPYMVAVPSHLNKGVEQALMVLVLTYLK